MNRKPHRFFSVAIVAGIVLAALTMCPWNQWTGGKFKDIDLLADFISHRGRSDAETEPAGNAALDPELLALTASADSVATAPAPHDTTEAKADTLPPIPTNFTAPRMGDVVLLEDYSADGTGLYALKNILAQGRSRNVRIAMVGDSYIEGDILAQDLRAGLQSRYGGGGVGYVGAFSRFPGFRGSVNQASSGWDEKDIKEMKDDHLRTILGHYHTARQGAETRYIGTVNPEHVNNWQRTRIIFEAPHSGHIKFTRPDDNVDTYDVEGGPNLQEITVDGNTHSIRMTTDIVGLKVLGIWLENTGGIVLDDISLRGNSGLSHRSLSRTATENMRQWIDYDVIILEFGMNALSTAQTNYSVYGKSMVEVVNNLKSLYPRAQILIMGVGDRGTKIDGKLVSMPTLPNLIKEQREVARKTGSLFYDTRAAMGGEGAAIDWNSRKLLNSDFVHLNHKGGRKLAEIMLKSLESSLP